MFDGTIEFLEVYRAFDTFAEDINIEFYRTIKPVPRAMIKNKLIKARQPAIQREMMQQIKEAHFFIYRIFCFGLHFH